MLQSASPSESRPTRQPGRLPQGRLHTRGGIQKRNATPTRLDKDGDLVMGAAAAPRTSGSGSGRGASIRGSATARRHGTPDSLTSRVSSRPSRKGLDPSAIQKAVLRGMGSNETLPKGPRATAKSLRGSGQGLEVKDGLDKITIYGLKQSKAASNQDGGVNDLIVFLERKATERSKGPVKIKKVCLTSCRRSPATPITRLIWSALVSSQSFRTTTEIRRDDRPWLTCNFKVSMPC